MNILIEFWFIILYPFFLSRSIITWKGSNECNSDNKIILASDKASTSTKRQLETVHQHRNFFLLCSSVSPLEIKHSTSQNSACRDRGNRNGVGCGEIPELKFDYAWQGEEIGRMKKWRKRRDTRCLRVIYRACDEWGCRGKRK